MAMAEDVGHRLQRVTLMEHAGGKTMAKGMGAFAGELDTRGADVTFHDSGKRGGARQGVIGRPAGKKNLRDRSKGGGRFVSNPAGSLPPGLSKAGGYLCHFWTALKRIWFWVQSISSRRSARTWAPPYAVGVKQSAKWHNPPPSWLFPSDAAEDPFGLASRSAREEPWPVCKYGGWEPRRLEGALYSLDASRNARRSAEPTAGSAVRIAPCSGHSAERRPRFSEPLAWIGRRAWLVDQATPGTEQSNGCGPEAFHRPHAGNDPSTGDSCPIRG